MLRSVSLFTSRVGIGVVLALVVYAVTSVVFVVPAYSQTSGSGVTCSTVGGVYTCTQNGMGGTVCVSDASSGTQTCENLLSGSTSSGGAGTINTGCCQGVIGTFSGQPADLSGSTGWLHKLVWWWANMEHSLFTAVGTFLVDLVTFIACAVLWCFSTAISAIGVPSWLQNLSMNSIVGQAGPVVGYWFETFRIPEGFALIGAAYVFRLTRKLMTLGQW